MTTKKPAKPQAAAVSSAGLGSVSRETVMLAAGFCTGLAGTELYDLKAHEREILKAAGDALWEAGRKLYAS